MNWIKCSERMPKENAHKKILIFAKGDCEVAYYIYGYIFSGGYYEPEEVTYWMPLPAGHPTEEVKKWVKIDNTPPLFCGIRCAKEYNKIFEGTCILEWNYCSDSRCANFDYANQLVSYPGSPKDER